MHYIVIGERTEDGEEELLDRGHSQHYSTRFKWVVIECTDESHGTMRERANELLTRYNDVTVYPVQPSPETDIQSYSLQDNYSELFGNELEQDE